MMQDHRKYLEESKYYSTQLGNDFRRLYQLEEDGAPAKDIEIQKAVIETHKTCLKNVVRHNSG